MNALLVSPLAANQKPQPMTTPTTKQPGEQPAASTGKVHLSSNTVVSLGTLCFVALASWNINGWFKDSEHKADSRAASMSRDIGDVRGDVADLSRKLDVSNNGHVTIAQWRTWVAMLRVQNAALTIPPVPEVR